MNIKMFKTWRKLKDKERLLVLHEVAKRTKKKWEKIYGQI